MYLSKQQISDFVSRIGQPQASVLLSRFFQSYCSKLNSSDVASLYDDDYISRLSAHETCLTVGGRYRINVYNKYAYEYLSSVGAVGKRLLDYGCGDGDFAMACAADLGMEAVGVDFNGKVIDHAMRRSEKASLNCRFVVGNIEAVPSGERFHFVTLNDVVEHLSDCELAELFRALEARLSDRGELVIHTPNGLALCNDTDSSPLQWLYKTYLKVFKGWEGFERTVEQLYYDQVHINIKSYKALARLLDDCGYTCRVIYDSPKRYKLFDFLSSNMLVLARRSA